MKRTWWAWGLVILLSCLLGGPVASVVALNLALPRALEAADNIEEASYDFAYVGLSGRLHVFGLDMRLEDHEGRWWIQAPRASGHIDLAELADRVVHVQGLRGRGAVLHYAPPRPGHPVPERPWEIHFDAGADVRFREVDIAGHRLAGRIRVRGDLRADAREVVFDGALIVLARSFARRPPASLRSGGHAPVPLSLRLRIPRSILVVGFGFVRRRASTVGQREIVDPIEPPSGTCPRGVCFISPRVLSHPTRRPPWPRRRSTSTSERSVTSTTARPR